MTLRSALFAFFLVCFANTAHATDGVSADLCQSIKPSQTKINVNLTLPEPVIDLSRSKRFLNKQYAKLKDVWLRENGLEGLWAGNDLATAGIADGAWATMMEFKMRGQPVDRYGAYQCTFFDEINVELFYRTLIFIPSDYRQGSCEFKIVFDHEMEHHNANVAVVNYYAEKMRQDMATMAVQMEQGHIPPAEAAARMEEMKKGIDDAVKVYFKEAMTKEMDRQNKAIDSPEEYQKGSAMMAACNAKPAAKKK